MFDLAFVGKPESSGDRTYAWGRITLGTFRDEFQIPLEVWSQADYERQWWRAAERLVAGASPVVFLTHVSGLFAPYHIGWPAWRENHQVYVQERLFMAEQLGGPFDPGQAERYVGPRREVSDEGLPISQWGVRLRDVAAYLERHHPPRNAH